MDLGLDGKVCVVTGASRGIGLEAARSCAPRARTCSSSRATPSAGGGGRGLRRRSTSAADVTDPEADERIIATCAEQMGGIDVLVNNAGTSFARALDDAHRRGLARAVGAPRDGARCG